MGERFGDNCLVQENKPLARFNPLIIKKLTINASVFAGIFILLLEMKQFTEKYPNPHQFNSEPPDVIWNIWRRKNKETKTRCEKHLWSKVETYLSFFCRLLYSILFKRRFHYASFGRKMTK